MGSKLKRRLGYFGWPEVMHSDQGPGFESRLIKELCMIYSCCKSCINPYHPQGNRACEQFNQTLLSLLGTLEAEQQSNWAFQVLSKVTTHSTWEVQVTPLLSGERVLVFDQRRMEKRKLRDRWESEPQAVVA